MASMSAWSMASCRASSICCLRGRKGPVGTQSDEVWWVFTSQSQVSSFIDRATVPILKKYLNNERLSLTQIADRMNFTFLSYFSRYCTKHLGQSSCDYRRSLQPRG